MSTMKAVRHEILKEKWSGLIRNYQESGLSLKEWCGENDISAAQYYYWLKVIRQDSLIQAGTLAVTGKTQFVEVTPRANGSTLSRCCAILRFNGAEVEILNGADQNTLKVILSAIARS